MQNISLEDNRKNIALLFDRIALHYDLLNHLLTFSVDKYWRKKAIKHLDIPDYPDEINDTKILDVATGTADLAIEILKQKLGQTGLSLQDALLAVAAEPHRNGPGRVNQLGGRVGTEGPDDLFPFLLLLVERQEGVSPFFVVALEISRQFQHTVPPSEDIGRPLRARGRFRGCLLPSPNPNGALPSTHFFASSI